MQSAIPAPLSARAADARLSPAYYVRADGLGPYITDLLENCRSVFDIKPAMAADLDDAAGLRNEHSGVVEEGALVQGDVVVQAGARIEAGAQVVGPVLICTGAVVAAGALVRDHTVIGAGCRIEVAAQGDQDTVQGMERSLGRDVFPLHGGRVTEGHHPAHGPPAAVIMEAWQAVRTPPPPDLIRLER